VFGWVPIEEYTFFILQPIMVGLWLVLWARIFSLTTQPSLSKGVKARSERNWLWGPVSIACVLWLISVVMLISGWQPGTYLGLELAWALPPIILQLAFGGDILRRHWKLTLTGILPPALYLSAMDALAIGWGTWTIDPSQSTGVLLSGVLPLEEFVFFLLTNVLVTFGLVLVWAPESQGRFLVLKRFAKNMISSHLPHPSTAPENVQMEYAHHRRSAQDAEQAD